MSVHNYVGYLKDLGIPGAQVSPPGGGSFRGFYKFPGVDRILLWTYHPGDFGSFEDNWVSVVDAGDPENLSLTARTRIWHAGEWQNLSDLWPDPIDGHTSLYYGRFDNQDTSFGTGKMGTFTAVGGLTVFTGAELILPKGGFSGNPSGSPTTTGHPAFGRDALTIPLGPTRGVLIPNSQVQPHNPSESFSDFSSVGGASVYAYPFTFTQAAYAMGTAVVWSGGPQHVHWAQAIDSSRILLFMSEYGTTSNGSIGSTEVARWLQVMDASCTVGLRIDSALTGMSFPGGRVLPDGRVFLWEASVSPYVVKWAYLTITGLSISVDSTGSTPITAGLLPAGLNLHPMWAFPVWDDEVWFPQYSERRYSRHPDGSLSDENDDIGPPHLDFRSPLFTPAENASAFELAETGSSNRFMAACSTSSFRGSSPFNDYYFNNPDDPHRIEVIVLQRRGIAPMSTNPISVLAPFEDRPPPSAHMAVSPP